MNTTEIPSIKFPSSQISAPRILVPYYHREGSRICCEICPAKCLLDEGEIGVCGGRQVIDGDLIAVNYAQVCSLQLDSIEKKPLYHFFPGSEILSVGPNGCNLSCDWCLNWKITQNVAPTRTVMPVDLADMVDALDGIGVAYTYAEPLIWYEYVMDAGRILQERGLVNIFISNGYISPQPLRDIMTIADAFNIDLKADNDACYSSHCGGRLEDVQRTIRMVLEAGKHLEISHLMVSGVNDDFHKLEKLVDWLYTLDHKIPLHLKRYSPAYKHDAPTTSTDFLLKAFEIAKAKLEYVYLGNDTTPESKDSFCPNCRNLLIKRRDFGVEVLGLERDNCKGCGLGLPFVVDME